MRAISAVLFAGMLCCVHPASAAETGKPKETVLHSFGSGTDGQHPHASLIDVKGVLYGTTSAGGSNEAGTVFALDPETGAETVLYSFCSLQNCTDGEKPAAGVIEANDLLYGTTDEGGASGEGTVFSLDPGTGTETVLYAFCSRQNCGDGTSPEAGLIEVNGILYGTTTSGGANKGGTVFSLDPKTGLETVLYSFCGGPLCMDKGNSPTGDLIDVNGMLYGTAGGGGSHGEGIVFSLDPKTGAEKVPYAFCGKKRCADGEDPLASVVGVNGMLYGTTLVGGSGCPVGTDAAGRNVPGTKRGCGTVFSLDPETGTETVLHYFCSLIRDHGCQNGADSRASLIDVKGTLYGMTANGGIGGCQGEWYPGCGLVFSLDPNTGAEKVLYSFCRQQNCADGALPGQGGLTDVKGALYGTTASGGANGEGTVFRLEHQRRN